MLTSEGLAPLGEEICARFGAEILKLGFPPDRMPKAPAYREARFEHQQDPFSGDHTLCGYWLDAAGTYPVGMIKFHPDGTFYAEYDVARTHPEKPRWFVESIVVWGRDRTIKSEAKLIPAPE
jgi:hypothetical protein